MKTEKVVLKIPKGTKVGQFALDGNIESNAYNIIGLIVESDCYTENSLKTLAPEQILGARLRIAENA